LARDFTAQARAASGANILLGICLIASPWVFGCSGRSAFFNSVTVGTLVALLAAIRVASVRHSVCLSGINLLLGLWTIASPWYYEANNRALTNDVLIGVLIATFAIWSAIATDTEQSRGSGASGGTYDQHRAAPGRPGKAGGRSLTGIAGPR
jgi:hypothetical protein